MFKNILILSTLAAAALAHETHEGHTHEGHVHGTDENGIRRCGVIDLTDEEFMAAEKHKTRPFREFT